MTVGALQCNFRATKKEEVTFWFFKTFVRDHVNNQLERDMRGLPANLQQIDRERLEIFYNDAEKYAEAFVELTKETNVI